MRRVKLSSSTLALPLCILETEVANLKTKLLKSSMVFRLPTLTLTNSENLFLVTLESAEEFKLITFSE